MKKYPFKFLDSYDREDRGTFFGRDEEINALYEMVFQSSVVLLYGASGTGKTSLINCGLAGKFQPHDWLPLMVRRGHNLNDSLKKVLNDAGGKTATMTEEINWSDEWSEDAETIITVLSPVGKAIRAVYQNSFRPIYLIFDQFEELFILGTITEQELFIQTVNEILQSKQSVKLIFSIREEYLGHLFEFERAVPQLLQKKLRIEPMNLEKVKQVIIGAAELEDSNIRIKPGEADLVAEGIFEKIKSGKKSLTIQLPFLQVFLDKFYLKITGDTNRKAEAEFNAQALEEMGEIGDVLIDFLEEQVTEVSKVLKEKFRTLSPEITWKILSPFSTLEGTKEPISKRDMFERFPEYDTALIDAVVDAFINRRILRYNEGTEQFEIAHDALAKPIAEKRSEEDKTYLKARRVVTEGFASFQDTKTLMSREQLIFIRPYESRLEAGLNTGQQEFISQSKIKRLWQRRGLWGGLAAAFLAAIIVIFLVVEKNRAILEKNKELDIIKQSLDDQLERIGKADSILSSIEKTGGPLEEKTKSLIKKAENSKYLLTLYTLNANPVITEKVLDSLKNYGYTLGEAGDYGDRPSWFSTNSTVFYYSSISKERANGIAGEIEGLTGADFEVRRGAGKGVSRGEESWTFFIHYVGSELETLVSELYSNKKIERRSATSRLMNEFYSNSNLISLISNRALHFSKDSKLNYSSGIFNSVSVLNRVDLELLKQDSIIVRKFLQIADKNGSKTKAVADSVRRRVN